MTVNVSLELEKRQETKTEGKRVGGRSQKFRWGARRDESKELGPLASWLTRAPVLSSHLDTPWQVLVGAPLLP